MAGIQALSRRGIMAQSMSKEVNLILSCLIALWEGKYFKMVGSAFDTAAGE